MSFAIGPQELRAVIGPNGSGKSSLKTLLPVALQGIYLNPDELEKELVRCNGLDFSLYGITTDGPTLGQFLAGSAWLRMVRPDLDINQLVVQGGRLSLGSAKPDSYMASVLADFIRQQLLQERRSFTCETVMSSRDKVDLLAKAHRMGYRTYLYFIATEDPRINISRVKTRVALGGHDVPGEKIVSRYHRSLSLLREAIRETDRAYIFDNSGDGHDHTWLAEVTDGGMLELKVDTVPAWFQKALFG